jgi:hypothetical protein
MKIDIELPGRVDQDFLARDAEPDEIEEYDNGIKSILCGISQSLDPRICSQAFVPLSAFWYTHKRDTHDGKR